MTFDPRKGIRAKQVFLSFCDMIRDGSAIAYTNTQFTGNSLENFWGAYYGDYVENSVTYSLVDLGFDSTNSSDDFDSQAYDTIASLTANVVTLTTETTMTPYAHIGKYVIIKAAAGTPSVVFARITDNDASTLTLDSDVENLYGVAAADTITLLKVPCGLTMTAWQRLDHIATNLTIEPPRTETEDNYFLGSSDSAGSQNVNLDSNPQTNLNGSVTIRGGTVDLMRLKYQKDATVPAGTIRYNLGSESSDRVGFTAVWSTNTADPDNADAVTQYMVCNNVNVTNVVIGDQVDADGRFEGTVEFTVKGADVRVEVYANQANDTANNI